LSAAPPGFRLASAAGLGFELASHGAIQRITWRGLLVNLFVASELEGGPANLFLRERGARITAHPLLGPESPLAFTLRDGALVGTGWQGALQLELALRLARDAAAWFWHLRVENRGPAAAPLDLVCAHDLALADPGAARSCEYYVSQYLDCTPLAHAERGVALALRQGLGAGGGFPFALFGSLGRAVAFASDALQLYGAGHRSGEPATGLCAARLPGRLQHEHALAALQEAAFELAPGQSVERGFCVWLEANHPRASGPADLALLGRALALPEAEPLRALDPPPGRSVRASRRGSLFSARPPLAVRELDDAALAHHFGRARREEERDERGHTLAFFRGADRHVVLRAKELACLRAHGQILRSGDRLTPDEDSLTSTVWMSGAFHSLVTVGHVSIGRFASATRSYLGLFRSHGLRVFVEIGGEWIQLGTPSAFEMSPNGARWIYEHAGGCVIVESDAALRAHELALQLRVERGSATRFLISLHVAAGGDDGALPAPVDFSRDASGISLRYAAESDLGRRFPGGCIRIEPHGNTALEAVARDAPLFLDGESRELPYLTIVTVPSREASFSLRAELAPAATPRTRLADESEAERARFWHGLTGELELVAPPDPHGARDATRAREMLPWFAHDAAIHYLAPRGLEQFSGGGWGTRDVCQGPVEWLLAIGRHAEVRDVLLRVFRAQNPDGDWPQWFTFFERDRNIRPTDAHGDIVFWPLLALARYLLASGDAGVLDEPLRYFDARGVEHGERASLWSHAQRALALIRRRVVAGTALAAYGHGDWDDSLQPADPSLREHLCSSWTVTLQYQTLDTLSRALHALGRESDAGSLAQGAAAVRGDFQRWLLADGVVAGFAHFGSGAEPELWFHPRDRRTGVHYRLLPMIHAITSGLFTPEQAHAHLDWIHRELLAPDGARLVDKPLAYRGGEQRLFQRGESSSFFGREIGLMYMHAHIRYAEALAELGLAEAFARALRRAIPVGIRDSVPSARPRQSNCYASSSDAAVADRYEAFERYSEIKRGAIPVEAGWRVYSSGAGLSLALLRERWLGLRLRADFLELDPVLARAHDGLRVRTELFGYRVEISYRVGPRGCGVRDVIVNGNPMPISPSESAYRAGAVRVSRASLCTQLRAEGNALEVVLR
jgi:cellobiose phosphorylase